MNEVIDQLAEQIKKYKNNDDSVNPHPNEEDKKNMISISKKLIDLKRKELSAYNMLLCNAAHSLGNEEVELIDSLLETCKVDLESLEDLRSSMKSITY